MPRSKLLPVMVLALQSIAAISAPHSHNKTIDLQTLNGAGVHLVDCHPRELDGGANSAAQFWLSLVIYCENNDECNDIGHIPASRDICIKRTSNESRDYHKWENSEWQSCHFPDRGAFSWVISRFGRLFPPATEVGLGEDADLHDFAGFRDDELQGAGPATHNCSKVYYFA